MFKSTEMKKLLYGAPISRFSTIFSSNKRKKRKSAKNEYDADMSTYRELQGRIEKYKNSLIKHLDWFDNKERDCSQDAEKIGSIKIIMDLLDQVQSELCGKLMERIDENIWILKRKIGTPTEKSFYPWFDSAEETRAHSLLVDYALRPMDTAEGLEEEEDYHRSYSNDGSKTSTSSNDSNAIHSATVSDNDNSSDYYCEGARNYASSYRDKFAVYSKLEDLYDQNGKDIFKRPVEDILQGQSTSTADEVAEAVDTKTIDKNGSTSDTMSELIDQVVDEYIEKQRVIVKQAIEQVLGLFEKYDSQAVLNSLNQLQAQLSSQGNVAPPFMQQASAAFGGSNQDEVNTNSNGQNLASSDANNEDFTGMDTRGNNDNSEAILSDNVYDANDFGFNFYCSEECRHTIADEIRAMPQHLTFYSLPRREFEDIDKSILLDQILDIVLSAFESGINISPYEVVALFGSEWFTFAKQAVIDLGSRIQYETVLAITAPPLKQSDDNNVNMPNSSEVGSEKSQYVMK